MSGIIATAVRKPKASKRLLKGVPFGLRGLPKRMNMRKKSRHMQRVRKNNSLASFVTLSFSVAPSASVDQTSFSL
jgi:hypothetical protein